MTAPEVSFIMPVWNPRAEWLLAAVHGVLAQRDVDSELIVIDDGNDIPVGDLLAGIDDPRLHVERIAHAGVGAARNVGLERARGRWLRFADADDVQVPGSTAHLLRTSGRSDDLISYGATLFCDAALRPVWTMTCDVQGSAVAASLTGRFTVKIYSMLIPRRIADLAGPWNPRIEVAQDKEWCLRLFEHAPVRGDRTIVTHYRKHPSSISQTGFTGLEDSRSIVREFFARHPELRGSPLERQARAATEASAARVYLVRGPRRQAVRHIWRAARLAPRALLQEARQSWPALAPTLRQLARPGRWSGRSSPPAQ